MIIIGVTGKAIDLLKLERTMLGVIIIEHGAFTSRLLQALEQVVGRQTLCMVVDFPEGHSTEELRRRLVATCDYCDNGNGVVFLNDMLNGSLFREGANIALAIRAMKSLLTPICK